MLKYFFVATAALAVLPLASSQELPDDVRAEILSRCRSSMGEYGAAMVRACAEQDAEAYRALLGYPAEWAGVIARCRNSMGEYGWAMIKACADQDIEAEKALEDF